MHTGVVRVARGGFALSSSRSMSIMGGDLDSATKWRMAKFAAVGVPMLITGGLASLSVHSPDNRARIEPYMPGFVQYLRDNIGFDDEDKAERERIAHLRSFCERDQVVVARGSGGDVLMTKSFPGGTLLGEVEFVVRELMGDKDGRFRIEFEDSSNPSSGDAEGHDTAGNEWTSGWSPILRTQKSLWNSLSADEKEAAPTKDSSNAEYLKLFCMFYPPNMLSNRLQGLRSCYLLPDSKVLGRKENRVARNDNKYIDETIRRLDSQLRQLDTEKKAGSREIDQIESEIKAVNARISELKWKKWSFF